MLQEDKLEPSEQLGDLLKQAGDADAALKCYRSSGATTKVIEGELQPNQLCVVAVHVPFHDTLQTHRLLSHLFQPTATHIANIVCQLHLQFSSSYASAVPSHEQGCSHTTATWI